MKLIKNKTFIGIIFSILIGIVISSDTVSAVITNGGESSGSTISASSVTYSPGNSSFNANYVSTALNTLYNRVSELESSSSNVYYLGTATTYNIQNMFPDIDYTSLTASNFLVVSQGSGESHVSNGSEQTCWLRAYTYGSSVSYDNTTGQVTINRASSKANCSQNVTRYFTAHTYLVTGTITDVTS